MAFSSFLIAVPVSVVIGRIPPALMRQSIGLDERDAATPLHGRLVVVVKEEHQQSQEEQQALTCPGGRGEGLSEMAVRHHVRQLRRNGEERKITVRGRGSY